MSAPDDLLKLGNINGAKAMFRNAVRFDPSLKPKVDEALANKANRCENRVLNKGGPSRNARL